MPSFGKNSLDKLSTCHPNLQVLFNEVIKYFDCSIICGYRNEEDQNKAFLEGKSKLKYPNSKHNTYPSIAVDVVPYFSEAPHIRWQDIKSFYNFAGFVKGIASIRDIKIRWGGDWDMDQVFDDQTFMDYPHWELLI